MGVLPSMEPPWNRQEYGWLDAGADVPPGRLAAAPRDVDFGDLPNGFTIFLTKESKEQRDFMRFHGDS